MDQSFNDKLETLTQDNHAAKQQISLLTVLNADLQNELTDVLEKEKQDQIKTESAINACHVAKGQVAELTERLQMAVEDKESAEKRVEELLDQVCSLQLQDKSQQSQPSILENQSSCESETAVLQEKLAQLELDMELKSSQLADAVTDLHKAIAKNNNMKFEMDELNVELECLQSQMSSQCNIIQSQREELDGMRSQADTFALSDTNKKGNSLFAEVEDRRVMVETEMVRTLDKCKKLESRLTMEKKENQRLKSQVTLLMRSANKGNDKTVRLLEQELEDSKKQVIALTEQLTQKSEQLQQHQQVKKTTSEPKLLPTSAKGETPIVSYLKATVAQLQKDKDQLTKEKDNLKLQCVQQDFFLTQKTNENRSLKAEKDRLTSLNAHLSLTVDSLKSESDSSESKQQREMVKITDFDMTGVTADELMAKGQKQKSGGDEGQDLRSFLLGSKSNKAVSFSDVANVLTEVGNREIKQEVNQEDADKKGKLKRSGVGNGTGKYKSVSYVKMEDVQQDENAPECKQQ